MSTLIYTSDALRARIRTFAQVVSTTIVGALAVLLSRIGVDLPAEVSTELVLLIAPVIVSVTTVTIMWMVTTLTARFPWIERLFIIPGEPTY